MVIVIKCVKLGPNAVLQIQATLFLVFQFPKVCRISNALLQPYIEELNVVTSGPGLRENPSIMSGGLTGQALLYT